MTGRRNPKIGEINSSSKEDRVSKWYEHFKKLLGEGQEHETSYIQIKTISESVLAIQTGPFTNKEYRKVKENIIDGKAAVGAQAPGPDGIAPEILKYGNFDDIMLEFSNKIFTRHEIPSQWLKCNIVPFPKYDNLEEAGNYSGITLSVIAAKMILIIRTDSDLEDPRPHIYFL